MDIAGQHGGLSGSFETAMGVPAILSGRVTKMPRSSHNIDVFTALSDASWPTIYYKCAIDEYFTIWALGTRIADLTGFAAADFINNNRITFIELYHKDDRNRVFDTVGAALETGDSFELTYKLRSKGKQYVTVEERGWRVQWAHHPPFIIGTIIDVATKKLIETATGTSRRQLAASLVMMNPHLSLEEIATICNVSAKTIQRDGIGKVRSAAFASNASKGWKDRDGNYDVCEDE